MLHLVPWGFLAVTYILGSVAIVYFVLFYVWESHMQGMSNEQMRKYSFGYKITVTVCIVVIIPLINYALFNASQPILAYDSICPWYYFMAAFILCANIIFGAVVGIREG